MRTLERLYRAWCGWRGHQLIKRAIGALFFVECIRCGYQSPGIITGVPLGHYKPYLGIREEDELERARR